MQQRLRDSQQQHTAAFQHTLSHRFEIEHFERRLAERPFNQFIWNQYQLEAIIDDAPIGFGQGGQQQTQCVDPIVHLILWDQNATLDNGVD